MREPEPAIRLRPNAIPADESAALRPSTVDYGKGVVAGDMAYSDTNVVLDRAAALTVGERPLADLLRYEDASMWQFLPSFIWPDVFRAVELTKCLDMVVAERMPVAVTAEATGDRYEEMWSRLVESFARTRGIEHRPGAPAGRTRRPEWVPGPRAMRESLARRRGEAAGRRLAARDDRAGRRLVFAGMKRHWVGDPARPGEFYDEQIDPLLPALRAAGWTCSRSG